MLTPIPASDCVQAREAASARLDNELSEIGAARLDGHLRTCSDCSNYARELESLTAELRAATLVRPGNLVVLPPRRRGVPMRVTAAAAAVVALLTVSSLALGRAFNGGGSPAQTGTGQTDTGPTHPNGIQAGVNEAHLLAQLRGFQQVPVGPLRHVKVI
jgi:predicted anti-sigma-YlaC factor YlaD